MNSAINKKSKIISMIVVFFIILFIGLAIKSSYINKVMDYEIEEETIEYESYEHIQQDYIVNYFDEYY